MKPKVIQITSEPYGPNKEFHMLFVLREDGTVERWSQATRFTGDTNEWEYYWVATTIQPEGKP